MAKSQKPSLLKSFLFLLAVLFFTAPLYVLSIRALYGWRVGKKNALTVLVGGPAPGLWGHSAQRFGEAETAGKVDVVVVGSSNSYRSLDTRIFEAAGVRLFHLGSPSQTPVNSYYVLRQYLPRLRPRVILVETNWHMLTNDGVESYIDLINNLPRSEGLFDMALAIHDVEAINLALGRLLTAPEVHVEQRKLPGDLYVKGGFVERHLTPQPVHPETVEWEPRRNQLRHLEHIIAYGKSEGAEVILFVQPLPREIVIRNAAEIRATLTALAKRNGVSYLEFPELDTVRYYGDDAHLNQAGAAVLSEEMISALRARGLAPAAVHP